MKALTFKIKLIEPLLTTRAQVGEENSSVASFFIPGGMLRGALVARHLGGRQVDAEKDETMRRLFLSGEVMYLNAYPARPEDGARSLPRPLCWFVPKGEADRPDAKIFDFGVDEPGEEWLEPPKPPGRGDFYWGRVVPMESEEDDENGGEGAEEWVEIAELYSPEMQMTVHNFGENRNRKDKDTSDVFRYDALAPGEIFSGVIISEDADLLTGFIKPLLSGGDLFLGKSSTGGYGRVDIADVALADPWREQSFEGAERPSTTAEYVRLVCLSDVILRNTGTHPLVRIEALTGAKPVRAYWRPQLVGGFNRKWGLPVPQAWGIAAGSVFVFPGGCEAMLQGYVETGMGEQRVVGYGRVAVGGGVRSTLKQQAPPVRAPEPGGPGGLSPEEMELLKRMANRRLEAKVREMLTERTADLAELFKRRPGDLPSAAQLSRARIAARRAWRKSNLTEIKRHFEGFSRTTKKDWERARIGRKGLSQWIMEQIDNVEDSRLLGEIAIGGVSADFDAIRERTVARFIEEVLRQAIRVAKSARKREEHGGQSTVA